MPKFKVGDHVCAKPGTRDPDCPQFILDERVRGTVIEIEGRRVAIRLSVPASEAYSPGHFRYLTGAGLCLDEIALDCTRWQLVNEKAMKGDINAG